MTKALDHYKAQARIAELEAEVKRLQELGAPPAAAVVPHGPYTKGDTAPVGDCDKFEAGIHVDEWFQRIVVYGDTSEDAEQLRDVVLAMLARLNPAPVEQSAMVAPEGWRDLLADSMRSLEELAFAGELELSCQKGVVISCACNECMTDRAVSTLGNIRAMLAAAPTPEPASPWISIRDRLPQPGVTVLVFTPPQSGDYPDDVRISLDGICPESDGDYWLDHGEHYEHWCCIAKGGDDIDWQGPSEKAPYTHWAPLPAAPEQPAKCEFHDDDREACVMHSGAVPCEPAKEVQS